MFSFSMIPIKRRQEPEKKIFFSPSAETHVYNLWTDLLNFYTDDMARVHACMLLPTFHVLKQWSGFKKYSTITFILLWFLLCLHLCSCWVANSTYLLVYYTRRSKYSAKKLICFVTCNKCVNERTEKKGKLGIFVFHNCEVLFQVTLISSSVF